MLPRVASRLGAVASVAGLGCGLTIAHVALSRDFIPLADLAAGAATMPFARRVLIPALAGWLAGGGPVLPAFLALELVAWLALAAAAWTALGVFDLVRERTARFAVALTGLLPVAVHLCLPTRVKVSLASGVVGDATTLLQPFTSVAAAPNFYYPWDVPSAAFVLWLVVLTWVVRQRAGAPGAATAYLAVFAVATLNRETTILLVPFAACAWWRHVPRGRALALAGLAVVCWAAMGAGLKAALQAPPNPRSTLPGGSYEWMLGTNLKTLAHPAYLVAVAPAFAGGAWLPLVAWGRRLDGWARLLLASYVLPALVVVLVFGIVLEYRVFAEVTPAVWLAAVAASAARWRGPVVSGTAF